jgi:hypothetical protein
MQHPTVAKITMLAAARSVTAIPRGFAASPVASAAGSQIPGCVARRRIAGWLSPARAIAVIPGGPDMNFAKSHASFGYRVVAKIEVPEPSPFVRFTLPT